MYVCVASPPRDRSLGHQSPRLPAGPFLWDGGVGIIYRNGARGRTLCWLCSVVCWRCLPPQRHWDDVRASPIHRLLGRLAVPLLLWLPGGTGGILLVMKIPLSGEEERYAIRRLIDAFVQEYRRRATQAELQLRSIKSEHFNTDSFAARAHNAAP